jgi:hypothetical protein
MKNKKYIPDHMLTYDLAKTSKKLMRRFNKIVERETEALPEQVGPSPHNVEGSLAEFDRYIAGDR